MLRALLVAVHRGKKGRRTMKPVVALFMAPILLAQSSSGGGGGTGSGILPANSSIRGPLKQSTNNSYFLADSNTKKEIFLSGSHTWSNLQDTQQGTSGATPSATDFCTSAGANGGVCDSNSFVQMLVANGHNVTILWKKDLPFLSSWQSANWNMSPWPFARNGPGNASDGNPKFDLTTYNQAYFDRLRQRAITLGLNGIYAVVELFDGLGCSVQRSQTDAFPFTANATGGQNNINSINDGYTSGNGGNTGNNDAGCAFITMTSSNSTLTQEKNYVNKVIQTVNDLPNVIFEISEEADCGSDTYWAGQMISYIHTTEASMPFQHPVLYPTLNELCASSNDVNLFNSAADIVSPRNGSGSNGIVSSNNNIGSGGAKVLFNDGDHSNFGMWSNSNQTNRQWIWENVMNGGEPLFMDPFVIYLPSSSRNNCTSPTSGLCSSASTQSYLLNERANLGYVVTWANKLDLAKVTPQGSSCASTSYCLAQLVSSGYEALIYAPSGGTFTVNTSATSHTLTCQWFDPNTGSTSACSNFSGGSATQSFTTPGGFAADSVLYIVDQAGHA